MKRKFSKRRIVFLFLFKSVLLLGVKKNDPAAVIRRPGLAAPAHSRPTLLQK